MATAPRPGNRQHLRLARPHEDGHHGGPSAPVNRLHLVLGLLGGPLAFVLVRLAGLALLAGRCTSQSDSGTLIGPSTSQQLMVAITVLCAFIAGASGIISWHVWRQTRRGAEKQTGESERAVPFWALGGLFLSGVFFLLIVLTGALALGLSTSCVS